MHSSDGVEAEAAVAAVGEKAIPNLSMRIWCVYAFRRVEQQIQHSTDCIDCNNFCIANGIV